MVRTTAGPTPTDDEAVEVQPAGDKGLGVFARRPFSPGEIILRWQLGRVVRLDQLDGLAAWEREHLSEVTRETCQILPPPRCYVNHACEPNAVSASSDLRARLAIQAGDEITIDYRLNALDDWEMACACTGVGGPHVVIGRFLPLPPDRQREYLVDAPAFVQEAYRRQRAGD